MIATALLLAFSAAGPSPLDPKRDCAQVAEWRSTDGGRAVVHAFQNGGRTPLRLSWIDQQGKRVALEMIAPGAHRPLQTYVGHAFELTDPKGKCRAAVRVGEVLGGTYVGTSRYRPVAVAPGWHVFIEQSLDPKTDPARTALAAIARSLADVEAALPPAALAQVRDTPIFLHLHSGPGGMFHPDPDWLVAHGRTVEMTRAIEVSDAAMFVESLKVQPSAILHELSHAYYFRMAAEDRTLIEATFRRAMERGLYRNIKRYDGSTVDAYARSNAAEYFAELSEAWYGRNDFFPFTRAELERYDPGAARMLARVWQ